MGLMSMIKIKKLIRFPEQLITEIESYQSKNGIPTFTATVLELTRMGLKHGTRKKQSKGRR